MMIRELMLVLMVIVSGCASQGNRPDQGPDRAMARLPEQVKIAADAYIATLSEMTRTLGGVTDSQSARATLPRLEGQMATLAGHFRTVDGSAPATRADVRFAFHTRLANANEAFASQVGRIKGTPGVGPTLGPLLDKIPRFR